MKTLDEHNAEANERWREFFAEKWEPAGVACPTCGAELLQSDRTAYTSFPPVYSVKCACGFTGQKVN